MLLAGEDLRNRNPQTRENPRDNPLPPAAAAQLQVALPVLAQAVDPDRLRGGICEPDLGDTRFQVSAELGAQVVPPGAGRKNLDHEARHSLEILGLLLRLLASAEEDQVRLHRLSDPLREQD